MNKITQAISSVNKNIWNGFLSFAKPVFLLTAAVAGLIYTAAYSGIATARILGMENTALVVFICWGYVILFVLLGWYITTVIKKYKEL